MIPIYGHRFIPDRPHAHGNPVFSVHQTDIIYYGANLEEYLENEFHMHFGTGNYRVGQRVRQIEFWTRMVKLNEQRNAGHIKPANPNLLTDHDVEYSLFHCCGDEDLVFLRCSYCGHIWVECYECSTWYTDLDDLSRTAAVSVSSADERLACPRCGTQFADFSYFIDAYLPTAEQVIDAGFGRFLSRTQRQRHGVDPRE